MRDVSSGNGILYIEGCFLLQLDFHCHVFVVCTLASLQGAVGGTPGVVWRRLLLGHDVCDCLAPCVGAVKTVRFMNCVVVSLLVRGLSESYISSCALWYYLFLLTDLGIKWPVHAKTN